MVLGLGSALGSLAGAGLSGILGSNSASAAKKANRANRTRGLNVLDQNTSTIRTGFADAQQSLFEAMGLTKAGFESARSELGRLGGSAKTAVLDQSKQALAAGGSDLQRAGFGSGSIMQQYRAGVGAQTGRALASVDEDIASLTADLLQRQGLAQAQVQSQLSNLYRDRTAAFVDNEMARFNLFTGVHYEPTSSNLGGLTAGLQGLFGNIFGDKKK